MNHVTPLPRAVGIAASGRAERGGDEVAVERQQPDLFQTQAKTGSGSWKYGREHFVKHVVV